MTWYLTGGIQSIDMKNKLTDLNNYLFEQLEKLNDDDMTQEELSQQIVKAETISKISKTIIETAQLQLNAIKVAAENGVVKQQSFHLLLGADKNE